MPYIDLHLSSAPNEEQAATLARGITDAMVAITHKRREVTAVRITADAVCWFIGGESIGTPTAYMEVKITEDTNSAEEKAALQQHLYQLLHDTLGGLAKASYIVIHELPAKNWGYAGISQSARALQKQTT